jgi:cell division protein ZapE
VSRYHNEDVVNRYKKLVESGQITGDADQERVIQKFQQLNLSIKTSLQQQKKGVIKKIFRANNYSGNKSLSKGLYIYGDVGRGKSMLMDLFFETGIFEKKRRVHFNSFMLEIHQILHKYRKKKQYHQKDPIPSLAKEIANDATLLCFDEFQVTDIADAMIMSRLFTHLFNLGVFIVATSNRIPDDLYKDGLQRESFIPFIDLLKKNVEVVHLASQKDYRLGRLQSLSTVYYYPLDQYSESFLQDSFNKMTNNAIATPRILDVGNRKLEIEKTHGDVAWTSFKQLCEQPYGAVDYIAIAKIFNTLILSNIPKMSEDDCNEAKRFVTLIDELYEHKVKLICTAQAHPKELYIKGKGSFEFSRTVSRLMEMQSAKYLSKS